MADQAAELATTIDRRCDLSPRQTHQARERAA